MYYCDFCLQKLDISKKSMWLAVKTEVFCLSCLRAKWPCPECKSKGYTAAAVPSPDFSYEAGFCLTCGGKGYKMPEDVNV